MENIATEICNFFPDLEGKISVADLKSPTNTFVRDFYCRVLIELGIDVDNVRKVQMVQLDAEEVVIIPELNLVTAIRVVFPFLNFQLDDLLSPDVKRNAQLISQVMKFLQFSESRLAHNNEKIAEFQNAKIQEKELAKVKERETANLNALACKIDSQEQAKLELAEEISKLQNDENKLKDAIKEKKQIFKYIQDMNNTKQNKIDELIREIEKITASCEEYNRLIVQNPEEEKSNFQNTCRLKDCVIQTKKDFQEKYETHKQDLEILNQKYESLNIKISPILDELHILQDCSDLKKSNEKTQERIQQAQKMKEELIKKLFEIDQSIQNENQKHKSKLDLLKNEETCLAEKLAARECEYKLKSQEKKIYDKKYQRDLEKVENKISTIESDYKDLLTNFNSFMQEFQELRKQMAPSHL